MYNIIYYSCVLYKNYTQVRLRYLNSLFWVKNERSLWLASGKARDEAVTRFPGTRQEEDKQNKPERKTAWIEKIWH